MQIVWHLPVSSSGWANIEKGLSLSKVLSCGGFWPQSKNKSLFQKLYVKSQVLLWVCVCVCVCVYVCVYVCVSACSATQSCLTLCDPMDCSLPGSSIHGILQARILEWGAISYSRGSSQSRDWTHVSCILCIGSRFLTPLLYGIL